jgi:predicted phosphodiesterase
MHMPQSPLDLKTHRRIHELIAEGLTRGEVASQLRCGQGTVTKYAKIPLPESSDIPLSRSKSTDGFPEACPEDPEPLQIEDAGFWGIISDIHVPHHDEKTIRLFVAECKKRKAVGVLLNGDILDFYGLSRFDKDPTKPKLKREIEIGRELLAWLRKQLPGVRLLWKEGNHEERLWSYLANNCAALFDLDELQIPSLLQFEKHRVEYINDRNRIDIGKLAVVHGHEFFRGFAPPVNPARGLYLRAKSVALCGHHHQTSTHRERTVKGREIATWSTGCACNLSPRYARFSNWNHGFAFVELEDSGEFRVENLTVREGKVNG